MRGDDQMSRIFDQLCALLLTVLRMPHAASPPPRRPVAVAVAARRRRPQVSPAGFAALLLGASMALMLCGSVTFVIGFIMMPWVLGMVMVFYFFGILSSLSGLGRAILGPVASPSSSSPSKEMNGHIFSRLPFD